MTYDTLGLLEEAGGRGPGSSLTFVLRLSTAATVQDVADGKP